MQTSTETGNQHKYQTRVVSSANKVNLKFPEAQPVLSRSGRAWSPTSPATFVLRVYVPRFGADGEYNADGP